MTAPVNISVLVPVYNVEPYLAQCLESICSQTLRELEIVCVDDASTDGSLSILREFAERDPRVKVVQAPENGGLSRSRNLAMSHAVGEYLFLVDSDDWLETDLLEEMYRRAKALDADRLDFSGKPNLWQWQIAMNSCALSDVSGISQGGTGSLTKRRHANRTRLAGQAEIRV